MIHHKVFKNLFIPLAALVAVVAFTSCGRHCDDCCVTSCSPRNCDVCGSGIVPASDVVTTPATPVEPPKAVEKKPDEVKPEVPKPVEKKPDEVKPEVPKSAEKKPDEVKPDTTPKAVVPPANTDARKTVRIKAGSAANWKDKDGNEWLADAGFMEGAMVDLGKVKVDGTDNPDLYTSEHSNMEKFAWSVPNGKYAVKLHFVENPDDVKKEGDRVFSIDVNGEKIEHLDIFKEAGGVNKALVKTAHVTVTGGKIEINFKAEQKEALINGIEIVPE